MGGCSRQHKNVIYDLEVSTDTSTYPIYIGEQLTDSFRELFKGYPRVVLLTNDTIFDLYNESVIRDLENDFPFLFHLTVKDGEKYKNIETLNEIYEEVLSKGLGRDGFVVAFGGGVIGDLAGFTAATFMRGVDYAQIPTTLLAMVDSSIGGKTGINLSKGKNMVGSFHHPKAVFCDLSFLDTLPVRHFNAGLMEVIKYGLILDEAFYNFIVANRDSIAARNKDAIAYLVYRCCGLKVEIVGQDEKDKGIRSILNFGHTIGHALESCTGYDVYLHGEAVALGSLAIIRHLVEKGVLSRQFSGEFEEILDFFGLPTSLPPDFEVDSILRYISYDKKREHGTTRWVTLRHVGSAAWGQSVDLKEIEKILRGLQKNG
jgi:3-dehydroquinate synthase